MPVFFYLGKGDTGRPLEQTLGGIVNGAFVAQDLTGASVKFYMRKRGTTTLKVNGVDAVIVSAAGQVRYNWQPADVDEVGWYEAWWVATYAGPKPVTFPAAEEGEKYVLIEIGDAA